MTIPDYLTAVYKKNSSHLIWVGWLMVIGAPAVYFGKLYGDQQVGGVAFYIYWGFALIAGFIVAPVCLGMGYNRMRKVNENLLLQSFSTPQSDYVFWYYWEEYHQKNKLVYMKVTFTSLDLKSEMLEIDPAIWPKVLQFLQQQYPNAMTEHLQQFKQFDYDAERIYNEYYLPKTGNYVP